MKEALQRTVHGRRAAYPPSMLKQLASFSDPRWLFFRLAILVTVVLLLPDVYILYRGQPADAVAVLMVMHLAIALVTYNLLVRLAPIGPGSRQTRTPRALCGRTGPSFPSCASWPM